MATDVPVKIHLKLQDAFSGPLANIKKRMHSFQNVVNRVGKEANKATSEVRKLENRMAKLGIAAKGMAWGFGDFLQPLKGGAVSLVQQAMEFELLFKHVTARMSLTEEQIANLKNMAQDIGVKTGLGPNAVIQAAGAYAKANIPFDVMQKMMEPTLMLAKAEGVAADEAAKLGISLKSIWNVPTAELPLMIDQLAVTLDSSQASLQDLMYTLKYAAPAAATAGIGKIETFALSAVSSMAGVEGSTSGTGFRGLLPALADPTRLAGFAKHGFTMNKVFRDREMTQYRDLFDILKDMVPYWEKMSIPERQQFTGKTNAAFISAIMADLQKGDASTALRVYNDLQIATGKNARVSAHIMEALSSKVDQLKASWQSLSVELEKSGAMEPMKDFIDLLIRLMKWVKNAPMPIKVFLVALLAIGASLGPILSTVGNITLGILGFQKAMELAGGSKALLGLIGRFGLLALGITAVVAALAIAIYYRKELKEGMLDFLDWTYKKINGLIELINKIPLIEIGKIDETPWRKLDEMNAKKTVSTAFEGMSPEAKELYKKNYPADYARVMKYSSDTNITLDVKGLTPGASVTTQTSPGTRVKVLDNGKNDKTIKVNGPMVPVGG